MTLHTAPTRVTDTAPARVAAPAPRDAKPAAPRAPISDLGTWRKGWALLERDEKRRALVVLCIVIASAVTSALMVSSVMPFLTVLADPGEIERNPVLAGAYHRLGFDSRFSFLVALGGASLLVICLASAMQVLRAFMVARFTTMRVHTISNRLLSGYLRQPFEFFLGVNSNNLGTRILAESFQVVEQFYRPAADVISATLTCACIIALLVAVNPVAAGLALGIMGGVYGLTFAFTRRRLVQLGKQRLAANSARFRIAGEALTGIKDIKLLGKEAAYVGRFRAPSLKIASTQVQASIMAEVPLYVMQALAFGGMILLCLALLDPRGLEEGTAVVSILPLLGLFAFAGQRLMPEIHRLYRGVTMLQYGAAAVASVHADVMATSARGAPPASRPAPLGLQRELRLEDVTYRYPNAAQGGLDGISLDIAAGEKIGIVGTTGAGKTTLANVILGLLRPTGGTIRVDGVPLEEANLRAWQASLGYVPQDIFLADASLAENVALGEEPDAIDQAKVLEALRIAQLRDLVDNDLPEGVRTHLGERGLRLSGGQRQRVGIARALYHDADLIVFDEATSALDNLTEREVMASIEALEGRKTILLIAHRLTTVRICDRILVLDRGRIAGLGTWDELFATNPIFRQIATAA
jgi:ABC-type multidrug transport system fused ATPase/permease subunit